MPPTLSPHLQEARQRRKVSSDTATKAKEWKQNALRDNAVAKQKQQQQAKQAKQPQAGAKRKAAAALEGGEGEGAGKAAKQQGQGQGQAAKKARRESQQAGGAEEKVDFKFARIELEDGELCK